MITSRCDLPVRFDRLYVGSDGVAQGFSGTVDMGIERDFLPEAHECQLLSP